LLHFPENPEVDTMNKQEKYQFLKNFDLSSGDFKAYISDFGLSTIVYEGNNSQLSICGTPLYSSPQLLKKKGYSYKVDIWAIGIMCYELLMGRTPFHSYEMKDLIYKINKGDYTVTLNEPVSVECALFLSSCL
jgi:serine/threonine protein kinase